MINLLDRGLYVANDNNSVNPITIGKIQFKQVLRNIGGAYVDYEPVDEVPSSHVGWMYDGADVMVDGKRYKIRSRAETAKEYEMLSR